MALLNKDPKKKPLQPRAASGGQVSSLRPVQVLKRPPCSAACAAGSDARGWLTLVAQRDRFQLGLPEALDAAFAIAVDTNPFPAVMGRTCSAPCEASCNRKDKDGAVSVNATERWIGDWGLERKLRLPRCADAAGQRAKVAVVGAGPAGLSCAYQLARRGHAVTVIDASGCAGGALRSVPASRLPARVLDAEIARILDLGVELRLSTRVDDVAALRGEFDAVCLAVGPAGSPADASDPARRIFRVTPEGELPAHAVGAGRRVAVEVDAALRGVAVPAPPAAPVVGPGQVQRAAYESQPCVARASRPPEELALDPSSEADLGITQEQFLVEAKRCYSCGMCFDCERCFLYCQNGAFEKLQQPAIGRYYRLRLEACNGCKKCGNMCPCGCIDMA
jgi:NADPH-dependent glutamate synthase beta subunit-like oxidoreductase